MRIILCLLVSLSPFMHFSAFADRGPAVAPIVEISAEDNSPVPPSEAVAYDFSNRREIASTPAPQTNYWPLVTLVLSLPLFVWFSMMMKLSSEMKKRDSEWENLASFPRSVAPPAATPVNPDEDVEEQYKKAS